MANIENELVREGSVETMTLSKLLDGVRVSKLFQTMYGQMVVTHEVEIQGIAYDSRKVRKGDMFVAISGIDVDGHRYIESAIHNGAKAVVVEDDAALPDSYFMHAGVIKIVVQNSRAALARLSANYFNHPAEHLAMVGITGTNGKTTTSMLVKSILESAGQQTGLVGTIEYSIGNKRFPATHTTPESLELSELLSRMVQQGCTSAVMEVSSHALHQHRVDGIPFRTAVFTNLTQDHLDYHKTMEEYFDAKAILFRQLSPASTAVVNLDDPFGTRFVSETRARAMTYAIGCDADVKAEIVSLSVQGTEIEILHRGERTMVESPLIGRFNVSNILAAFCVGLTFDISKPAIAQALHNVGHVAGRFEPILGRQGWTAIIDYAHTPDALQKTLFAIADIFEKASGRKIITVFGCGGNRDRTKRPTMGQIASELSDLTIITSDNPRKEDPVEIIREVEAGVLPHRSVLTEVDRGRAITMALDLAHAGDVVLIAGKGHEDYQIIGDKKIHFSDREIVESYLRKS